MFMNKDFFAGMDPEDAFLDSSNIPGYNTQASEGKIVKHLSTKEIYTIGIVFMMIILVFILQLFNLQIIQGDKFYDLSTKNRLIRPILFAERGVIVDRFDKELAWNEPLQTNTTPISNIRETYSLRKYADIPGISHLIGYLSYPMKDRAGNWWRVDFIAGGGVEKSFDNLLKGKNGNKLIEIDAKRELISTGTIIPPVDGSTLHLSIDAELVEHLYDSISKGADVSHFTGGAGVIMDVSSGDIIAITSYPEYDSNTLTNGTDRHAIAKYSMSDNKPFLNRAVQGTYTPGSIIKPYIGLVALQEGIISPHKKLLSTGVLKIPNPYYPGKFSTFRDWSTKLGWLDMRHAIKMSSSIYFYIIGGGFEEQEGLGIERISKWAKLFGFGNKTGIRLPGEKSGVIPTPKWKKETFGEGMEWNLGNTYHSAIGQYGWLVTPIQAVTYITSIANGGKLYTPKLNLNGKSKFIKIPIDKNKLQVIHDGMRMGAKSGTAQALNINGIKIAAKTGTAQLGKHNEYMNSWVVGFWPYENPRFAFAVVLEKAPANTLRGAAPSIRPFFEWIASEHGEDYAIGKYPDKKLDIIKE
jgi:penicillin-binding protein 2